MKKLKKFLVVLVAIAGAGKAYAQDPSFSQFFASPLNINPALTGDINSKWRLITNYRNQWIGPANPYTTGTLSFDSKIFQNLAENYLDENFRVGVGGMIMYDQAMAGVLKSNYASFNVSGNILLANGTGYEQNGSRLGHNSKIKMDEGSQQRLGIGLGVIYGHKHLDFNKLTFGEQFNGAGFDQNLPTGESALTQMKSYISTSAGILYSFIGGNTNFDLGASAFHFNKPRQTWLDDDNQVLATRYVVHANLEKRMTDKVNFNINGIYQNQANASYFSVGGNLAYDMSSDDRDMLLNAGLWYWNKNAIIPYVGLEYGNFQLGLSYDITISDLKKAPKGAQTFELCLILRGGEKGSSGVIPAPWK